MLVRQYEHPVSSASCLSSLNLGSSSGTCGAAKVHLAEPRDCPVSAQQDPREGTEAAAGRLRTRPRKGEAKPAFDVHVFSPLSSNPCIETPKEIICASGKSIPSWAAVAACKGRLMLLQGG